MADPVNPTTPVAAPVAGEKSKELPADKLVPEKDLLAIKTAKEGLEQKLKEAEDSYNSKISEANTKLIATEATVKQLQDKLNQSNLTAAETAKLQSQLDIANSKVKELEIRTVDARKKLIASSYKIPVDTLKDKSIEQLDLMEEAIKAVAPHLAAAGTGFAAGAGGSGSSSPETPLERAKRVLQENKERAGAVRQAAPPK